MPSEMQTRRATCESIKNILDGLPVVDSPDKLQEERSMLNEYQRLIEINESLQQCRQNSTSIDSIIEMQSWLDKEAPESGHGDPGKFTDITGFNQDQMGIFRLPETDRIYRQSVGSQQRIVREVLEWHNNTFPVINKQDE
ncbi:hypothetical protein CPB86DRAFT_374050 [Serendipita vermifera]|nr:hypothetical protein CPB86DRAFT_374050 [Serendipita vermifera]